MTEQTFFRVSEYLEYSKKSQSIHQLTELLSWWFHIFSESSLFPGFKTPRCQRGFEPSTSDTTVGTCVTLSQFPQWNHAATSSGKHDFEQGQIVFGQRLWGGQHMQTAGYFLHSPSRHMESKSPAHFSQRGSLTRRRPLGSPPSQTTAAQQSKDFMAQDEWIYFNFRSQHFTFDRWKPWQRSISNAVCPLTSAV